jgi:hypothetical protein
MAGHDGVISLLISVLQRTLSRQSQFIKVPEITLPLIVLAVVVLGTAKLTGGFGLRMLGSDVYGGRKYVFIIGAILGYFALTALRIPPHRARLALALFFLGGISAIIGELYLVLPSGFNLLFWFFSPDSYASSMDVSGGLLVTGFPTRCHSEPQPPRTCWLITGFGAFFWRANRGDGSSLGWFPWRD